MKNIFSKKTYIFDKTVNKFNVRISYFRCIAESVNCSQWIAVGELPVGEYSGYPYSGVIAPLYICTVVFLLYLPRQCHCWWYFTQQSSLHGCAETPYIVLFFTNLFNEKQESVSNRCFLDWCLLLNKTRR